MVKRKSIVASVLVQTPARFVLLGVVSLVV